MTSPTLARKAAKLRNHLVSAKAKLRHHVTLRRVLLLAAASAASFLLLLTLRTLSAASHARSPLVAASSSTPHVSVRRDAQRQHGCAKLPSPVVEALVHYATANATPEQTAAEVAAAARVLARRAPCNLLVFGGLGHGDGALWAALNHGGRTAFFEEDAALIADAAARHPGLGLEPHQVAYRTTLADADELLALRGSPDCTTSPPKDPLSSDHFERSPCKLALRGLPAAFYETEWDVIMVDAPAGWVPEAPGRTGGAIYMAGMAARARRPGSGGETDVVVHDVDRTVEDSFSRAFLCEGYLKEEVGRLRHFAIPSHREKEGMPFCP